MGSHIAVADLSFSVGEEDFNRRCLVSAFGALLVFDENDAPPLLNQILNKPIPMTVNGIQTAGFFVREHQANTSYYSIQFESDESASSELRGFLDQHGAKLPPRRRFPRLDARKDLDVAVPHYALVSENQEGFFYSVVNFTIGGLLLESFGPVAIKLNPDQKIDFELYLSDGSKIDGMHGQVVRVRESASDELLGEKYFQYGVRIDRMEKSSYETYRKVIYNYCIALNEDE